MTVRIITGDALAMIPALVAEGVVCDAVVTDPPYGLEFMGQEWDAPWQVSSTSALFGDRERPTPGWNVTRNATCRLCGGRLRGARKCACPEPAWDEPPNATRLRQMAGFQDWCQEWASQLFAILRPGGHLVAFGGTRTYHRMVCAIEDAGFEIRDTVCWLYGTGFPKSHNVGKAIDKAARGVPHGGADPTSLHHGQYKTSATEGRRGEGDAGQGYGAGPGQFMAVGKPVRRIRPGADQHKDGSWEKLEDRTYQPHVYVPGSEEAQQWTGWGTALKPAFEPIVLARKPLDGTVAENVLRHGTGAINVDGCRIDCDELLEPRDGEESAARRYTDDGATNFAAALGNRRGRPLRDSRNYRNLSTNGIYGDGLNGSRAIGETTLGRWPANVATDGSDEVLAAFPDSDGAFAAVKGTEPSPAMGETGIYGHMARDRSRPAIPRGDSGSAARFFFSAKAGKEDRWGSRHPTVKPVALMRWLCRLVTPPGGLVLDCFAGSGTTGVAALAEGFDCILIEREDQYIADIKERVSFYEGGGKHSVAAKNRNRKTAVGSLL